MEGRPVTLRTFDIGGDKLPEALAGYATSDIANPALGLRAIRLSLKDRRLLDVQLAAMLRAATSGPVRIMLPMISTPDEMRRVREAMEQVARRLKRRGVRIPKEMPPLGAMIEVPAAALAADALYAALLLGLGLRELSMAPRNIPRVKQRIRNLDMVAASRRARAIMDQPDAERIAALLDDFNATAEGAAAVGRGGKELTT